MTIAESWASVATRRARLVEASVAVRLPFADTSASLARVQLREWMVSQGSSGDHVDDARLIISELVANAIRHAQPLPDGNLGISWRLDPRGVQVAVTDGGAATQPRRVHAPASARAGRGLALVEELSISWWAERTRSRSTVYAVLSMG